MGREKWPLGARGKSRSVSPMARRPSAVASASARYLSADSRAALAPRGTRTQRFLVVSAVTLTNAAGVSADTMDVLVVLYCALRG